MSEPVRLSRRERGLVSAEVATVGLPFCVFKWVSGATVMPVSKPAGWALLALAAVDVLLNLVNLVAVVVGGRRLLPVCGLQAVALTVKRSSRSANVGSALDVALSFGLVAAMIGTGSIPTLSAQLLRAWNAAVILNVLGAGALRLVQAAGERSESP